MSRQITDLEPKYLYHYFHQINQIPRCSKNEQKVGEYLLSLAKEKGLESDIDSTGNVVIRVPATSGREHTPTVILQSHTDMVCEKNKGTEHDFSRDPIKMKINGDWIEAEGTTLGSDNGIGLAASLAILEDKDVVHGPLELLFTVDEETGLTGAQSLGRNFLKGRILLNMDSEEEGELYIGCASEKDTTGEFPVVYENIPGGYVPVRIAVTRLKGGHSGIDIQLGRANAIKLLAKSLRRVYRESHFYIAAIEGGSKRNAIPREAETVIFIKSDAIPSVKESIANLAKNFRNDYVSTDPDLNISVEDVTESFQKVFSSDSSSTLIRLLDELPHGVIAMSADVPGLVETSTNLATITRKNGTVVIGTSHGSSIDSERNAAAEKIAQRMISAGSTVKHSDGYPGWKPNLDSEILKITKSIFTQYYEKEPAVKAIHAGLECGIIGEKYPGMDMISFGPTITGPHSPDERVYIPSVKNFYNCLLLILKKLAEK